MLSRAETIAHEGGRSERSHDGRVPRLADLGLNYNQSARWQAIAAVPEEAFEAGIRREMRAISAGARAEVTGCPGYARW